MALVWRIPEPVLVTGSGKHFPITSL